MSTAHDLWLGQAKLRAAMVSRVLLRGVGVVGGGVQGGGVGGGCGGDPPPPSGDPELLEAPKAAKKFFGLN